MKVTVWIVLGTILIGIGVIIAMNYNNKKEIRNIGNMLAEVEYNLEYRVDRLSEYVVQNEQYWQNEQRYWNDNEQQHRQNGEHQYDDIREISRNIRQPMKRFDNRPSPVPKRLKRFNINRQ